VLAELRRHDPGDRVEVDIRRQSEELTRHLTLADGPERSGGLVDQVELYSGVTPT
jgi:hypothetical protein